MTNDTQGPIGPHTEPQGSPADTILLHGELDHSQPAHHRYAHGGKHLQL